ncbi:cell wall hydrolase [Qipengyuania marisflavi]|uniref:Cell wall hydrolase n=2 Tax=Qipengyuania marisflavi TaxID=2486356 RepID=A0A5S3PAM8_9SPHN|nr:cell wall hydrolase [Qipengyuania marisflavi]
MLLRGGALAAAMLIPAVAAQGEWAEIARAVGLADERVEPVAMPFETAGLSFPGSAFYYLEDAPRLAGDLSELRAAEGSYETLEFTESHGAEATARAFRSAGSGLDKARALQCLSMAVYYEAASESYTGQQAVAQVVLNRVAHPAFPSSVCGVVFQGSERKTGCQFSFTCDGSMARHPSRQAWARAQSVGLAALAGEVQTTVGLATHYHTNYVNPYWAASLDYIGRIGAHRFYVWKGRAGQAGAFSTSYLGGEPVAAPSARRGADTTVSPVTTLAVPTPNSALGMTKAPDKPVGGAPASPAAQPQDNLPKAGDVKAEYQRSGRWISEPGKKAE